MKFIGQFIQHFISRFKNDVFLEDISTGTIASGGNLGLDSNNKIVKADVADGDITAVQFTTDDENTASDTSGAAIFQVLGGAGIDTSISGVDITITGETASSSNAGIVELATTAETTTGTDTGRAVTPDGLKDGYQGSSNVTTLGTIATGTWQGTAIASAYLDSDTAHLSGTQTFSGAKTFSADVTFSGDTSTFTSANADDPAVIIQNTTDDNQAARLQFVKNRGAAGQDSDNVAELDFYSYNDAGTPELVQYGKMAYRIDDATDGQESGKFQAWVATHDGSLRQFLLGIGGSTSNETDVTLANGAASVTTIAGTLTMGSTATINNSGVVQVAAQTVIDHDQLANYAANEHYTQANITTVGTIDTGVWNGTAIASAYMASATASAQGAVELATTGEADTGTDTARAVTPAGLKSHVDARYSYAYMVWSASGVSTLDGSDPEWVFPNTSKGIYEEDWNKDEGIKATSVGATTYTVTRFSAVNGLVVPHTGVCVGFHAHGRNDDSDVAFKAGLFHLEGSTTGTTNNGGVDYGNTGMTNEATLRFIATSVETESSGGADGTSGHSFKGPCKLVSNTDDLAVTAGDVLLPAIMGPDASDEIFITMTIILKVPLTT